MRLLGGADVDARARLGERDALDAGAADEVAVEGDRAARVVIARDRVGDAGGVRVGVDHRDHRDAEAVGFLDGDLLLVGVDHEQQVGRAAHVLDAAQGLVELFLGAGELQHLTLGEAGVLLAQRLVDGAQRLDRVRDGLPVGERAAQPAGVHVILGRALGGISHLLRRRALGADEQHAAALGHGVRHGDERLVEQRNGLREVDDVDAVAAAIDVVPHLRVPAVGLVAEVHASFEQLTHGEIRQCHANTGPFPVDPPRGK